MASTINIRERLNQLARERILILDGAMGSYIPRIHGGALTENDFRGERFKNHPSPLKGCNDLLCLTMPGLISEIHKAYLKSGADIIETCSFNATAITLADYGLGDLAYEINVAAASIARKAADSFSTAEKPRFVAGVLGPTGKSAGICQDLDNPEKRAVTWDNLEAAYYDNARGLLDGGSDIILIETIFDSLNAKAAIFAVRRLSEERGIDVPIIVSATVSNSGGRLLSGQSVEAFCVSVLHANPLALGLNCSFGAEKLKPHIAAISAFSCLVSAHPNAGLPNHTGAYDESPDHMANQIEGYMRDGLVNIIGGCCGSTPDHIAAIAEKAKNYSPRKAPLVSKKNLLAGLEVLEIRKEDNLAKIKGNADSTNDSELSRLIKEGNYEDAAEIARDRVESGAALVDICLDDVTPNDVTCLINSMLMYPDVSRLPVMISSARWDLIEAGLKCLPGKGLVNFTGFNGSDAEFLRLAHLAHAYGAAVTLDSGAITFFDAASKPV